MILECKNVCFGYQKNHLILDHSNLSIQKGDFVTLLGPNGNGKTTLLKCMNKLLKIQGGTINVLGKDITQYQVNELSKLIGYVPQYLEFANMSVFDAILMGRIPYIVGNESKVDLEIVQNLIKRFDLESIAFRNVNELSGGERQKVAIARALSLEPKILLFDEPTSNLDIRNQIESMNLIQQIAEEKNLTVIITMHDINLALRYAKTFVLMKKGRIIEQGDVSIINQDNLKKVFDLDVNIERIDGTTIIIPK